MADDVRTRALKLIYSGTTPERSRFTQDSPILPDVWVRFFDQDFKTPVDVLLTPNSELGVDIMRRALERLEAPPFDLSAVGVNESHVVARTGYRCLLQLLPLTHWWMRSFASDAAGIAARRALELISPSTPLVRRLAQRILEHWDDARLSSFKQIGRDTGREIGATLGTDEVRFAGLVNLVALASVLPLLKRFPTAPPPEPELAAEIAARANEIASAVAEPASRSARGRRTKAPAKGPIWSITLNRKAEHAVFVSRRTVKADAAQRVFDLSARDITWAVVDSGIDARHPAFADNAIPPAGRRGKAQPPLDDLARSRIVRTLDFTRLRDITSGNPAPDLLDKLGRAGISADAAEKQIREVNRGLRAGRMIDWAQLLPLLEVPHTAAGYVPPVDAHGTHVAGILGADWRGEQYKAHKLEVPGELSYGDIVGVCRDIRLLDLRAFRDDGGDEFSILAALQFVRFLNQSRDKRVVHGVNLSFSLWHDVRNYACGSTPVCLECDRLVGSGVVVVAAAGNYGYERTESDYLFGGAYRGVSITDPGNAAAVLTVGATHRGHPHEYGVSYFSSRGPTGDGRLKPDLVAPGERIRSTIPDERAEERDGTSMAAPHVSGAAALLMARHEELIGRPAAIKDILCRSATDLGRERSFQGAGLVDALRALQSV